MSERNRSEGWTHAKRTGHENEKLVAAFTSGSRQVQNRILACAHITDAEVVRVAYGGIRETDVDSVLGGKTKSKTDMWLSLSNGQRLNISIKKDEGGQVFLGGIDRFVRGFEQQYKREIGPDVKRALSLYFGAAEDTLAIIEQYGTNAALEKRKHRLVADTLLKYDPKLYLRLLSWVNENIGALFDFCFAKGLAANSADWAQIVWYKNMVGENALDAMFFLPDMAGTLSPSAAYGSRNGGSTIQLPFGFAQWHSPRKIIPGSIQFHHAYAKIKGLMP